MFKRKSLLKASSAFVSLLKHQKHTYKIGMLLMFCCTNFKEIKAQNNLVPNSSFEQYTNCPSNANLDEYKNSKPDYWYKPDMRGAAYVNACADSLSGVPIHSTVGGTGFQYARIGVAYVGMFYRNGGNRRNYFQVKLNDSLVTGKCYYAECYVNESNHFEVGCNNQSILLTNAPIYADTINGIKIILANPQVTNYNNTIITDTLNWIKVSGVFIAQGGEQYLTLGNFRDDNHTLSIRFQPPGSGYDGAAYYVDDVSLYALDSFPLKADAGPDTTIVLGDSVFIGSLTNGIPNVSWYDMAGNVIDTGRPGFFVHPTTTNSYIIEQTVCGYYSRDTVTVTMNVMPLHWLEFEASPLQDLTPAPLQRRGVKLNWQTANEQNVSHYNIQRSYKGTNEFENVGQVAANNKPYNEYGFVDDKVNETTSWVLYRLQSIDKDGQRSYSEIRRVKFGSETMAISIYPNPAANAIHVKAPNCVLIEVFNADGKKIVNQKVSSLITTIELTGESAGLYLIKSTDKTGKIASSKFIKTLK